MNTENDTVDWAKAHRAAFETEPLIEMRGSQKVQVGFTLTLYARLPVEETPGTERREASVRILERLRAIVASLETAPGSRARIEIEPTAYAVAFRPDNELEPEITLRARIFHGDDYFAPVTADERQRLSNLDGQLEATGLRKKRW